MVDTNEFDALDWRDAKKEGNETRIVFFFLLHLITLTSIKTDSKSCGGENFKAGWGAGKTVD